MSFKEVPYEENQSAKAVSLGLVMAAAWRLMKAK